MKKQKISFQKLALKKDKVGALSATENGQAIREHCKKQNRVTINVTLFCFKQLMA